MFKKQIKFLIISIGIVLVILFLFFFSMKLVSGAGWNFKQNSGLSETAAISGYAPDSQENPVTLEVIIGNIITVTLSLVGVVFLILMIYGGFVWMNDRGNEEEVEKAKKIITAAVIGLVLVFASYAISYFIINSLQNNTLNNSSNIEKGSNVPSI